MTTKDNKVSVSKALEEYTNMRLVANQPLEELLPHLVQAINNRADIAKRIEAAPFMETVELMNIYEHANDMIKEILKLK